MVEGVELVDCGDEAMEYVKGEWFIYSAWHGPHAYLAAILENHNAYFFDQYTIGM